MNDDMLISFDDESAKGTTDNWDSWLSIDVPEMEDENQTEDTEETSESNEEKDTESNWDNSEFENELDELDKLLSWLDTNSIDEAVASVEASWEITPEVKKLLEEIKKKDSDLADLQDALDDVQSRVKTLNKDKYDLTYKNAELEAFGWVNDPSLMIVVKNYEKAKAWDKLSQEKIKRIMSDMYAWIYWEDLDKAKMDENVDDITSIESYNSKAKPNVDMKDKQNEGISL